MSKCKFIKPDKSECKANAIKGDDYCFWHSDKTIDKRQRAVTEGGQSPKRNYGREDEIKITNSEDILKLIEQTINDLRSNKTSTRIANAIGYLSGIALKVVELNVDSDDKEVEPKTTGLGNYENEEDLISKIQKALDALTDEGKYTVKKTVGFKKNERKFTGIDLTIKGSGQAANRVEPKGNNK